MRVPIEGEKPFSILSDSFMISPSNEGYTLNYSADGDNFTAWEEATPAGQNLVVTNCPKECYWKLVGNATKVIIKY